MKMWFSQYHTANVKLEDVYKRQAYPQAVHFAQQKDGNKAVLHRHSRNLESCVPILLASLRMMLSRRSISR